MNTTLFDGAGGMTAFKRRSWFAALLAIAILTLSQGWGLATPTTSTTEPAALTVEMALQAARLPEQIVATGPTSPAEDLALARSLTAYEARQRPDDVRSLAGFVSQYPHSGWAAAVHTNIGLSRLHYGYFSQAMDHWQKAWKEGRNATDPEARALVDRAVGELARLYAGLGKMDALEALFQEIGTRPVTGSATERVQGAREAISSLGKEGSHLFNCGPLALQALMRAEAVEPNRVTFLQWYRAGPNGTNMAELAGLADKVKFGYRLVHRKAGQPVPMPSIAHLKVGHFAAILGEANGRLHVEDAAVDGRTLWMSPEALDSEASGYFLVPTALPQGSGWRAVEPREAANVWGKGNTVDTRSGGAGDIDADADPTNPGGPTNSPNGDPGAKQAGCPMCIYNIRESSVSVSLSDRPVGYFPAFGPAAKFRISYNQREASQPATFNFFNVGQKWTVNWLAYVTDDPTNAGASVSRFMSGGGAFTYSGYNSGTGRFNAQDNDGSILVRVSGSPITYRRQLSDGSTEIYSFSDGAVAFPRRVFLTQMVDPQGNALTLAYDGQRRLTTVTDAIGRVTTLTYGIGSRPFLLTQVTDPFGRSATLTYNVSGSLSSITDVIGLTSSFGYDANLLVNSMTTPYGTTTFSYTAPGAATPPRFVQVSDPMGFNEREEWLEPSSTPATDPAAIVPTGMPLAPLNNYLQFRNSFHWDKSAYITAGCTPTGGCDYSKARLRHFTHVPPTTAIKDTSLESQRYPLENRVWYNLPGQSSTVYGGIYAKPSAAGRVLDDGTTQLRQFSYDTAGYFNLTKMIDPLGRTTNFTYGNQIDLSTISQSMANGNQIMVAQFTYDYRHRPVTYTDASGRMTTFTYNAAGQLTSTTNPLGQTTTYTYDASGNLTTVTNANSVTAASYTYDSFARVRTYTDSEGWTATYDYDAADRVTKITYPDNTTDTYTYNRLDLASYRDRQGRQWKYTYDANRRRTVMIDPAGQQTLYGYNQRGQLTSLTDPMTNVTGWAYDVQGRLTTKTYPDTSTVTYAYETTTSRLKSVTDALGQVKTYAYAKDDRPTGITYTNATNPTPNVTFAYDPYFPRLTSMTDGTGTKLYTYVPVGSLGALQLQQESGPLANSAIASAYDELGRVASRTVQGAGSETFQYDAIGRLTGRTNDLGAFTLSYLGQTGQLTSRQRASSTLATTFSYLNNAGDRRLAGVANVGLTAGQFSTFAFTSTAEDFVSGITETADTATVYPPTGTQTATYNTLNQLTNLSGQARTYDALGNLTSDGTRTYSWDAESRLVGIAYPGQPGKASAFTYDGLGRRVAIAETPPGGGSPVVTSYLWCDDALCQARDATNALKRSYYDEGEVVPGSPTQPYYYGVDQLGSVRRAFASTSSAPAYAYDPYGVPLQVTAPVTDFGYAGTFMHAASGLYLTNYRAYDSVAGRWLSRDPLGEPSDPAANLYPYVEGNPINLIDPRGTNPLGGAVIGAEIGTIIFPGPGTVVGAIVGIGVGAATVWAIDKYGSIVFAKPPKDAKDPQGAKAPGKPGEAEGFKDPKGGESWVKNPNPGRGGSSHGWLDDKGRVWCPTGPGGRAHGDPHWDVQTGNPKRPNINVRPGNHINDS
jgi:RHS repeat-associated protein